MSVTYTLYDAREYPNTWSHVKEGFVVSAYDKDLDLWFPINTIRISNVFIRGEKVLRLECRKEEGWVHSGVIQLAFEHYDRVHISVMKVQNG